MITTEQRLHQLTIKPTDVCDHKCPYCAGRQDLFAKGWRRQLSLEQWAVVFESAVRLGLNTIRVSGGEPTLYDQLPELIALARRYCSNIEMYSNGSRLSLEFAQKLQDVGLSSVSISLISINGELHDKLRQAPGSHFRALKACRAVVGSGLRLGIQFIVSRHNYCELPQVIQSAIELGAYSLELNYPENDIKTKHLLMCKQEILEWREQILPESLAVLEQYGNASSENIISLSGLYSRHSEIVDFSVGTYWSSVNEVSFCDKPLTFAMVYPNGDVLPCNAVEYTHEPIVGNVLLQPLDEIWQGSSFEEFRLLRIPWCQYCPMTLHARLELATPRAKDQLYQEHCASSV